MANYRTVHETSRQQNLVWELPANERFGISVPQTLSMSASEEVVLKQICRLDRVRGKKYMTATVMLDEKERDGGKMERGDSTNESLEIRAPVERRP